MILTIFNFSISNQHSCSKHLCLKMVESKQLIHKTSQLHWAQNFKILSSIEKLKNCTKLFFACCHKNLKAHLHIDYFEICQYLVEDEYSQTVISCCVKVSSLYQKFIGSPFWRRTYQQSWMANLIPVTVRGLVNNKIENWLNFVTSLKINGLWTNQGSCYLVPGQGFEAECDILFAIISLFLVNLISKVPESKNYPHAPFLKLLETPELNMHDI